MPTRNRTSERSAETLRQHGYMVFDPPRSPSRNRKFINAARTQYVTDSNGIEIDGNAIVSYGDEVNSAYVQAWVWTELGHRDP